MSIGNMTPRSVILNSGRNNTPFISGEMENLMIGITTVNQIIWQIMQINRTGTEDYKKMSRRKNINQEDNLNRQFSVSLTPRDMEKLEKLCKQEKRKRGAMVRIMIEEWFEDREREREMETKGKRIARGAEG